MGVSFLQRGICGRAQDSQNGNRVCGADALVRVTASDSCVAGRVALLSFDPGLPSGALTFRSVRSWFWDGSCCLLLAVVCGKGMGFSHAVRSSTSPKSRIEQQFIELISEIRRRVWIIFWLFDQSSADRIVQDIVSMIGVVSCVVNSVIGKTLLPHRDLVRLSEAIGVAALDELDRALKRTV
jgi:hypothetical protein